VERPQLVITLEGGSSVPLSDVAQEIVDTLETKLGMNVTLNTPPEGTKCWREGWDGFVSEESVAVRCTNGVRESVEPLPKPEPLTLPDLPDSGFWGDR